ncbi:HNH endonuclease [Gracilimonas sediminicola]|uniref:HNH endonuclease n=1 Tax=Gracilimonas sediminicola TaxID=2952158 RepID=A0A9X2L3K0_9BACT|nr:HNH endonuclease [Gracilimonas sediminicola]MCP9291637.1 HNH endonuclease [Gracilimonas sediminicola]
MEKIPAHILELFRNLNSDKNPKYWDERTKGRAPHKPFLLLSILDGAEQGWIASNQITLTQELVETFFTYWNAIMGEERSTTIALPFFYMKSEDFWKLEYNQGYPEYSNAPSLGGLQERVSHAVIDPSFFELFLNSETNHQLHSFLAHTYFSDEIAKEVLEISSANVQSYQYTRRLVEIAAEPFVKFHGDKTDKQKYRTGKYQVREQGFSRIVRSNYNYTCALCRNRVVTPGGKTLVEGAHIIPWSKSRNDDPRNGISLCRSHHWMFDTFMFTVNPNFKIQFSRWLKDQKNEIGELWELSNESILLPEESFRPSGQALEYHNEKFEEFQESF